MRLEEKRGLRTVRVDDEERSLKLSSAVSERFANALDCRANTLPDCRREIKQNRWLIGCALPTVLAKNQEKGRDNARTFARRRDYRQRIPLRCSNMKRDCFTIYGSCSRCSAAPQTVHSLIDYSPSSEDNG